MNILQTFESTVMPVPVDIVGDKAYYYNYIVNEKDVESAAPDGSPVTVHVWEYVPLYMNGTPDQGDVISELIRKHVSQDEELALVNKYNAFKFGITSDSKAEQDYKEFCKLAADIRERVKMDFQSIG